MKKVLLSLSVLFSAGAFAQTALTPEDLNAHPTSTEEQLMVDQAKARFHNANAATKKAGGPISNYFSHVDAAVAVYGSLLDNFIAPIFQDSTVLQDFGTPENVTQHGYAAVFDVYSDAFQFLGQDYFARKDAYTVDSVFIGGFYDVVNNKTAPFTGDTLVVDVVYGLPTNAAMFRQGLAWPANTWTNQPNSYPIYPVAFIGDPAQGYAGDVKWANKVTFKRALTPADSAGSATATGYFGFQTNLNIPAGQVVGVTARFKSGETYSAGDTYFAGNGSTTTATMNSFRVLISGPSTSGDRDAYFLEELTAGLGVAESYAGSGPLFNNVRYGQSSGDEYFLTQGSLSADWVIKVSGNSTLSLDNKEVSNEIALYPNPTSGNVTLEIAQGGTYTIDVLNLVGQVVYSEQVSINGGEKLNRDFSNLNKGVYLINLNGEGFSKTSKLTIK